MRKKTKPQPNPTLYDLVSRVLYYPTYQVVEILSVPVKETYDHAVLAGTNVLLDQPLNPSALYPQLILVKQTIIHTTTKNALTGGDYQYTVLSLTSPTSVETTNISTDDSQLDYLDYLTSSINLWLQLQKR